MKKIDSGPVAIIDVGSHNARLEIFEIADDGHIERLEYLSQSVPLGQDVFLKGHIRPEHIRMIGRIIQDFAKVTREYDTRHYKAIATAAVREASNCDLFVDMVHQISGIEVEILGAGEEARRLFLALRDAMGEEFDFHKARSLVCSIGTGSTLVSLVESGRLVKSEDIRVGALRVVEELERGVSQKKLRDAVTPFSRTMVDAFKAQSSFICSSPDCFIALGAAPRFLLSAFDKDGVRYGRKEDIGVMTLERFERARQAIADAPPAELAEKYEIPDNLAESLEASCVILRDLLRVSNAKRLIIPAVSTREAVILDYLREVRGEEDPFSAELAHVAEHLARRFNADLRHAKAVAEMAMIIFDKTHSVHGLDRRARDLLFFAAIVHDIGLYVSLRRHHKHSWYLIQNSHIPGLAGEEQGIVAAVARYHRRGSPRDSHPEYMILSPRGRVLVSKLAGILRIADSLDFVSPKVAALDVSPDVARGELVIKIAGGPPNPGLENWAILRKANLWKEVFGLTLRIVGK